MTPAPPNDVGLPDPNWIVRFQAFIAAALLLTMFVLGLTSMRQDSAIFDETAHIAAAYTYLRYGEFRLNPEHPPLMKDLASAPLQLLDLAFPDTHPAWKSEVNGQWELGRIFLYEVGNDADRILFWARMPILLVAVAFGGVLYALCRRRWGELAALVTLAFYTLSPNVIAHARYVTTDLGASVFFFLVLVSIVRFVEEPGWRPFWMLTVAIAAAQLVKFSALILMAYVAGVVLLCVILLERPLRFGDRAKVMGGGLVAATFLSVILVWIFYYPHTINMSTSAQDQLIFASLPGRRGAAIAQVMVRLNKLPLMKPLVQYLLGMSMVLGRVAGGGLTYFNGEVTVASFKGYFPELFLLKTQLGFLLMSSLTAWVWFRSEWRRGTLRAMSLLRAHFRHHLQLWVFGGFAAFYFVVAVGGNLNLGIRHLLPIYPPLFVLVGVGTARLTREASTFGLRARLATFVVVAGSLIWYGISTLAVHPSHTAYFNELIGGPNHADGYFSDSSVDWGQDLRRLKEYVDEHGEITELGVDYFGGGDVLYYFCPERRATRSGTVDGNKRMSCGDRVIDVWDSARGPYPGGYLAISETALQADRLVTSSYGSLRAREPVARIGYSIYLYKLR